MPVINCEINFLLILSANCVIVSAVVTDQFAVFPIIDTKLYVPVVTLSIKDDVKLLDKLKSCFKRTIS